MILRNLSEAIFEYDNPIAQLKKSSLVTSMHGICTSTASLKSYLDELSSSIPLNKNQSQGRIDRDLLTQFIGSRAPEQAWLSFLCQSVGSLQAKMDHSVAGSDSFNEIKTLLSLHMTTIGHLFTWIFPR